MQTREDFLVIRQISVVKAVAFGASAFGLAACGTGPTESSGHLFDQQRAQLATESGRVRAPAPSATLASTRGVDADDADTGLVWENDAGTSSITRTGNPPIVVPAGTPLAIELTANVNTKVARMGDTVEGRLASNLVVDERTAATVGSKVTGSVTELVSGSDRVGGTPTIGITFDSLVAENGATVPILARYVQQGTSETGSDAAKILGGAAAGAVIGHQVEKDDRGTVVGGIAGAAAGAAAAKKTGGEVKLRAGTVLNVSTETSFSLY
jgi:hypothetical protein